MLLTTHSFDISTPFDSPEDLVDYIIRETRHDWDTGSDIVLWPEYLWMALEPFCTRKVQTVGHPDPLIIAEVASLFDQYALPRLKRELTNGKFAVLGSGPTLINHPSQKNQASSLSQGSPPSQYPHPPQSPPSPQPPTDQHLRNRAWISTDGKLLYQDKIALTPWERAMHPGTTLDIIEYGGLRIALLICLDCEMPELIAHIKKAKPDLVLIPSATETSFGAHRITRCASAIAVQLSCYVATSPIVGQAHSCLLDTNVGYTGFFLPSLEAFRHNLPLEDLGSLIDSGMHKRTFTLDPHTLKVAHRNWIEPNPARLHIEIG